MENENEMEMEMEKENQKTNQKNTLSLKGPTVIHTQGVK